MQPNDPNVPQSPQPSEPILPQPQVEPNQIQQTAAPAPPVIQPQTSIAPQPLQPGVIQPQPQQVQQQAQAGPSSSLPQPVAQPMMGAVPPPPLDDPGKQKKLKKVVIIALVSLFSVAVLGFGAFIVLNMLFASTIKFNERETITGVNYSIEIPKGMQKLGDENDGDAYFYLSDTEEAKTITTNSQLKDAKSSLEAVFYTKAQKIPVPGYSDLVKDILENEQQKEDFIEEIKDSIAKDDSSEFSDGIGAQINTDSIRYEEITPQGNQIFVLKGDFDAKNSKGIDLKGVMLIVISENEMVGSALTLTTKEIADKQSQSINDSILTYKIN